MNIFGMYVTNKYCIFKGRLFYKGFQLVKSNDVPCCKIGCVNHQEWAKAKKCYFELLRSRNLNLKGKQE